MGKSHWRYLSLALGKSGSLDIKMQKIIDAKHINAGKKLQFGLFGLLLFNGISLVARGYGK